MNDTLLSLLTLARETLRSPADGARQVLAWQLSRVSIWQAMVLVVIVDLLMILLMGAIEPPTPGTSQSNPIEQAMQFMHDAPLIGAVILCVFVVLFNQVLVWTARAMGGSVGFYDMLLLLVWLQFIMLFVQAAQIVGMILLPPLGGLLALVGFVLRFWLMVHFVAYSSGFSSLGRAFGVVVLANFALAFGLGLLLALAGITLPTEMTNV